MIKKIFRYSVERKISKVRIASPHEARLKRYMRINKLVTTIVIRIDSIKQIDS